MTEIQSEGLSLLEARIEEWLHYFNKLEASIQQAKEVCARLEKLETTAELLIAQLSNLTGEELGITLTPKPIISGGRVRKI